MRPSWRCAWKAGRADAVLRRVFWCPLVFLIPPLPGVAADACRCDIDVTNGYVSMHAADTDLADVLGALATATGVRLHFSSDAEGVGVRVALDGLTVDQAFQRLLERASYVFVYATDAQGVRRLQEVSVLHLPRTPASLSGGGDPSVIPGAAVPVDPEVAQQVEDAIADLRARGKILPSTAEIADRLDAASQAAADGGQPTPLRPMHPDLGGAPNDVQERVRRALLRGGILSDGAALPPPAP